VISQRCKRNHSAVETLDAESREAEALSGR
jgi:hypothetical protein